MLRSIQGVLGFWVDFLLAGLYFVARKNFLLLLLPCIQVVEPDVERPVRARAGVCACVE